jgi:hypothetical protein
MFHRRVKNLYIQQDEGIQFSGLETKVITQQTHTSIMKRNEGILFPDSTFPKSRPLHIYRKTGPSHVLTNLDTEVCNPSCTISNIKWKMLGKNSFKYLNPTVSCQTCKGSYVNSNITCQNCQGTGCPVPSKDCKAPYYFDNSQYMKKKCTTDSVTCSAYSTVKINNPTFKSTWGAVSSSNLALRKKYDAIIKNNNSLFVEYRRRFKYTENPIPVLTQLQMKTPIQQTCYINRLNTLLG